MYSFGPSLWYYMKREDMEGNPHAELNTQQANLFKQ